MKLNIRTPNTVVKTRDDFDNYVRKPHGLDLGYNYQNLSNLSMLKDLSIYCGYQVISPILKPLIENHIPIEKLEIFKGILDDEASEYISQMKQLKCLDLNTIYDLHFFDDTRIINWFKNLPELQVFETDDCSIIINVDTLKTIISYAKKLTHLQIEMQPEATIELNDYNTILEMVKARNVETCLQVTTMGPLNIDVPADVLSENKAWLKIYGHSWPMVGFCLTTDDSYNLV